VGRDVDAEALGEPRDPRELVGGRRDDRAAQALQPPFEVDVGAVPFQIAGPGKDEVGPAQGEALEHRGHDHALGALGEGADVRVGCGFVAGDEQQTDRLRVRSLVVGCRGPRVADSPAVWRGRQVEGPAAGLVGEAELACNRCEVCAAGSFLARPDQDRAVALAEAVAELVALVGEAAAALEGVAGVLDPGTLAPSGLDPELDDRRALRYGLVAEDDDELRVADGVERQTERVERGARLLGQDRCVRSETRAHQSAQCVRLLDRLGAGERRHDAALRCAQQVLRRVERVVPGEDVEAAPPDALEGVRNPVA
jgi:hypothetical protein